MISTNLFACLFRPNHASQRRVLLSTIASVCLCRDLDSSSLAPEPSNTAQYYAACNRLISLPFVWFRRQITGARTRLHQMVSKRVPYERPGRADGCWSTAASWQSRPETCSCEMTAALYSWYLKRRSDWWSPFQLDTNFIAGN